MTNIIADVGIIGMGVAGCFASYKLSSDHPKMKIITFDLGKKFLKRKQQTIGALGCLPDGDGKLFLNDLNKVADITGLRKAKKAFTGVKNILSQIDDFKVVKDRSPSAGLEKKLKKFEYDISTNNHIQMYPKQIHLLSKYFAGQLDINKNVICHFDTEVERVVKQKGVFIITTDEGEYRCKKLIIAAGRSGWRWSNELYKNFGIIEENDTARFGVRIELNSNIMKDFNRSGCTLTKSNDIEIGPLGWYGSMIPEDHLDHAISAFRSNEGRWKTDKVSFNLIGNRPFPNTGFEQTDRIAKLTFLLSNDRIIKERVSSIMNGRSKISILPEYDWIKDAIANFSKIIPEIATKAYYYIPTIMPLCSKISLEEDLETDINGMYAVGESTSNSGILTAAMTGLIAADSVCK